MTTGSPEQRKAEAVQMLGDALRLLELDDAPTPKRLDIIRSEVREAIGRLDG